MNNVKINNEINMTYPDGFKEMGEEELKKHFGSAVNRWGAFDADKHIVLSVGWKKAGFFGFMKDAETYQIELESRLRRCLLNYQRIDSFKTKIAGKKKANGIRFEYRVNDSVSVHAGDVFIFKNKKWFYAVYYITRKNHAAEHLPAFEEVLKSITIG